MEVHEHPIIEGNVGLIKAKVVHKDFLKTWPLYSQTQCVFYLGSEKVFATKAVKKQSVVIKSEN
jgi:hypothetical protein